MVKLGNRTIRKILSNHNIYDPARMRMHTKMNKSFKMRQHFKQENAQAFYKDVCHLFSDAMPKVVGFAYWVKDRQMPASHQCKGILTDTQSQQDFWCQNMSVSHKGYCRACHEKIYVTTHHE